MKVDLPEPLGPVRPKRFPGEKEVETSSNRTLAPKRMETLLTEIMISIGKLRKNRPGGNAADPSRIACVRRKICDGEPNPSSFTAHEHSSQPPSFCHGRARRSRLPPCPEEHAQRHRSVRAVDGGVCDGGAGLPGHRYHQRRGRTSELRARELGGGGAGAL